MLIFRGRFAVKLDPKGRFALPTAYRTDMDFVITNNTFNQKKCLDVYSLASWETLEGRIRSLPTLKSDVQAFQRFYLASGQVVQTDSQNRLVIPQLLRQYADINDEIVLVGMGEKFEIWNANVWEQLQSSIVVDFDAIVSRVADLDVTA